MTRDELIAEVRYRMSASPDMLQLREAMEPEKQPSLALERWLAFLKRAGVNGNGKKDG